MKYYIDSSDDYWMVDDDGDFYIWTPRGEQQKMDWLPYDEDDFEDVKNQWKLEELTEDEFVIEML